MSGYDVWSDRDPFGPAMTDFRREVRSWFDVNVPPEWRLEPEHLVHDAGFLRAWQRTLYEAGWAGLSWPRSYGGGGGSLIELTVFQDEKAKAKPPPDISVVGTGIVGPMLMRRGSGEQCA